MYTTRQPNNHWPWRWDILHGAIANCGLKTLLCFITWTMPDLCTLDMPGDIIVRWGAALMVSLHRIQLEAVRNWSGSRCWQNEQRYYRYGSFPEYISITNFHSSMMLAAYNFGTGDQLGQVSGVGWRRHAVSVRYYRYGSFPEHFSIWFSRSFYQWWLILSWIIGCPSCHSPTFFSPLEWCTKQK